MSFSTPKWLLNFKNLRLWQIKFLMNSTTRLSWTKLKKCNIKTLSVGFCPLVNIPLKLIPSLYPIKRSAYWATPSIKHVCNFQTLSPTISSIYFITKQASWAMKLFFNSFGSTPILSASLCKFTSMATFHMTKLLLRVSTASQINLLARTR